MLFTHESPHSSFDIFFFNDTATTEIYTLSLHDALPIFIAANHTFNAAPKDGTVIGNISGPIVLEQLFGSPSIQFDMAKFRRSEEHTSELQSRLHLVCRLLLEKKKKNQTHNRIILCLLSA